MYCRFPNNYFFNVEEVADLGEFEADLFRGEEDEIEEDSIYTEELSENEENIRAFYDEEDDSAETHNRNLAYYELFEEDSERHNKCKCENHKKDKHKCKYHEQHEHHENHEKQHCDEMHVKKVEATNKKAKGAETKVDPGKSHKCTCEKCTMKKSVDAPEKVKVEEHKNNSNEKFKLEYEFFEIFDEDYVVDLKKDKGHNCHEKCESKDKCKENCEK